MNTFLIERISVTKQINIATRWRETKDYRKPARWSELQAPLSVAQWLLRHPRETLSRSCKVSKREFWTVSDKLRCYCRAIRRLSLSSAYDLLCLPIMISSILMRRMKEWPSLNTPTQPSWYIAISIIFNLQCKCFGARRHTVELKHSHSVYGHPSIFEINLPWIDLCILAGCFWLQ